MVCLRYLDVKSLSDFVFVIDTLEITVIIALVYHEPSRFLVELEGKYEKLDCTQTQKWLGVRRLLECIDEVELQDFKIRVLLDGFLASSCQLPITHFIFKLLEVDAGHLTGADCVRVLRQHFQIVEGITKA